MDIIQMVFTAAGNIPQNLPPTFYTTLTKNAAGNSLFENCQAK
jgi:hypothetical protein